MMLGMVAFVCNLFLLFCEYGESFVVSASSRPKAPLRHLQRFVHSRRRTFSFSTTSSEAIGLDEEFVPFPNTEYDGLSVVNLCMDFMMQNDEPYQNAGLEVCWNFSNDRCRAAQGGSFETFVQFAQNPVFASMINAQSYEIASVGPVIQGTQTRGPMQTVLVNVLPAMRISTSNNKDTSAPRAFLWTMQRERRPPRQGCWLVHECILKQNAFYQTLG